MQFVKRKVVSLVAKIILIVVALSGAAFLLMQFLSAGGIAATRGSMQTRQGKTIDLAKRTLIDKVLPALTQSPVVAPAWETKREVEDTIQTVRNLPDAQKDAVCKQVCGSP